MFPGEAGRGDHRLSCCTERDAATLLGPGHGAWFMGEQKENTVLYFLALLCSPVVQKRHTLPLKMNGYETVKVNRACHPPLCFKHSIEKQSYKESFIV